MTDTAEMQTVAPGLHILGPHRERFWMGNYRSLRARFQEVADAIEDKSGQRHADARRFLEMMDLDRAAADALAEDEAPHWLVNMPLVELADGGLLVYSPLPLDAAGRRRGLIDALGEVRVVVAPHAFHTSGLASFREAYPEALFLCPAHASRGLADTRPELRFHAAIAGPDDVAADPQLAAMDEACDVAVLRDGMPNEIVLYHRSSRALINADFVYKAPSFADRPGVGGPSRPYLEPDWFARAYQAVNLDPSPSRLLPYNRVLLARHPRFDRAGFLAALETVRSWPLDWLVSTHVDPLPEPEASRAIAESWDWLLSETDGNG